MSIGKINGFAFFYLEKLSGYGWVVNFGNHGKLPRDEGANPRKWRPQVTK
jgi:hypothetical protein